MSAETPQTDRGSCRKGAPFHHSTFTGLENFARTDFGKSTSLCSALLCSAALMNRNVHCALGLLQACGCTRRRTWEYGAGHYEPVLGTSPRVLNRNAIIEKGETSPQESLLLFLVFIVSYSTLRCKCNTEPNQFSTAQSILLKRSILDWV